MNTTWEISFCVLSACCDTRACSSAVTVTSYSPTSYVSLRGIYSTNQRSLFAVLLLQTLAVRKTKCVASRCSVHAGFPWFWVFVCASNGCSLFLSFLLLCSFCLVLVALKLRSLWLYSHARAIRILNLRVVVPHSFPDYSREPPAVSIFEKSSILIHSSIRLRFPCMRRTRARPSLRCLPASDSSPTN